MTGASIAFVLNDFMMKLVFSELSVVQGVFLRGLFVCPLLLLLALQRKQLFATLPRSDRGIIACRTAFEVAITFLFLMALAHLSLAHVIAVLQTVPLILTAFAAILLNEKVGWRRWGAVGTGFFGVMLIIKPGLDSFSLFSLYALIAAILIAVRDIITRQLSVHTPSLLVALVTALAVTGAGGMATIAVGWQAPSVSSWFLMGVAALAIPVA